MSIRDESGEPIPGLKGNESQQRFVLAGWQGWFVAAKNPLGTHEVWIRTETQIEAGEPIELRRVS